MRRFILRVLLTLLPLSGAAQVGCHRNTILSADTLFHSIDNQPEFIYAVLDCDAVCVFNLKDDYCYQATIWTTKNSNDCHSIVKTFIGKADRPISWGTSIMYMPGKDIAVFKLFSP